MKTTADCFETLALQNTEVVFLFIVQCEVVGNVLKQLVESDAEEAYKPGDMVIFHSNG